MAYLIITNEKANLNIDPESLKQKLQVQWTSVVFENVSITRLNMALYWKIPVKRDLLTGSLHGNQRAISLDASEEAVAAFSAWYRTIIPAEIPLFLCHDSSEERVEIHPNTTEIEILEEMGNM